MYYTGSAFRTFLLLLSIRVDEGNLSKCLNTTSISVHLASWNGSINVHRITYFHFNHHYHLQLPLAAHHSQ